MSNSDLRLLSALSRGYHLVNSGRSLELRKGSHYRAIRSQTVSNFAAKLRGRIEGLVKEAER